MVKTKNISMHAHKIDEYREPSVTVVNPEWADKEEARKEEVQVQHTKVVMDNISEDIKPSVELLDNNIEDTPEPFAQEPHVTIFHPSINATASGIVLTPPTFFYTTSTMTGEDNNNACPAHQAHPL